MDLFDYMRENEMKKESRWRPGCAPRPWKRWWDRSISSAATGFFTGRSRRISWASVIFYGPPGTGKNDAVPG